MGEAVAGIVANPASERDIQSLRSALRVAGVGRVMVWTEAGKIIGTVRRMVDAGASVIVCLGDDGLMRAAAAACGDVPLLMLPVGTTDESTVAGLAAGLLATHQVDADLVTNRATILEVVTKARREIALTDVSVCSESRWDPASLTELYCTFAVPDGVGLSSIPGRLCPSPKSTVDGVAVSLGPVDETPYVVQAPIAPGEVRSVGVRGWSVLHPGVRVDLAAVGGSIALDGQPHFVLKQGESAFVELKPDGPWCVDVRAVMAEATRTGLLLGRRPKGAFPASHLADAPFTG
ncbi:diacylglycerol kinase family protein [Amycolatopsis azurea]|uniref:ATP-NAD kinase n=1 Tax=Amycolatopsis azurea DSM 43854 TaxID=1238180 RepID=M2QC79_9PSEU|nr:diacylglycerol kinase family protein [Amycolatopsis azurea]EMD24341.1 Acetoin catabolism protein X [Amycolatopsis azurea DSM 43854]OOC07073.1 ATP-NAD kinase [Amycolatopsis azurea DSM 43854]